MRALKYGVLCDTQKCFHSENGRKGVTKCVCLGKVDIMKRGIIKLKQKEIWCRFGKAQRGILHSSTIALQEEK